MLDIREYRDVAGRSLFGGWLAQPYSAAARKVSIAIYRLGLGNLSNIKSVGSGVHECRIDFGQGTGFIRTNRKNMVILFALGTKKRQQNVIQFAKALW